ncbi:MAG: hypothetical protein COY75_01020, partial [Nitrospirae bacterium CG_4_10_14_0_8_um_filter_41_23]
DENAANGAGNYSIPIRGLRAGSGIVQSLYAKQNAKDRTRVFGVSKTRIAWTISANSHTPGTKTALNIAASATLNIPAFSSKTAMIQEYVCGKSVLKSCLTKAR